MPDRLATDLLRIARDPESGRLHRTGLIEVGLRAALFADLALRGRLMTSAGAPSVVELDGPSEPDDADPILAAVERAVAGRPRVAWARWYRHVRDDRTALTRELIEDGRWQPRGGPRPGWDETDAAAAQQLRDSALATETSGSSDPHDALLGLLSAMTGALAGRPRPRAITDGLGQLLDPVGPPGTMTRDTIEAAFTAAGERIRHPRRRGSMQRRSLLDTFRRR